MPPARRPTWLASTAEDLDPYLGMQSRAGGEDKRGILRYGSLSDIAWDTTRGRRESAPANRYEERGDWEARNNVAG